MFVAHTIRLQTDMMTHFVYRWKMGSQDFDQEKKKKQHNFHIKHKHYAKFQAMVTKIWILYARYG